MLQAELVAQFLCCIPLATVEVVLAWLKPVVPEEEQAELLNHVSCGMHLQWLSLNVNLFLFIASRPGLAAEQTPAARPRLLSLQCQTTLRLQCHTTLRLHAQLVLMSTPLPGPVHSLASIVVRR